MKKLLSSLCLGALALGAMAAPVFNGTQTIPMNSIVSGEVSTFLTYSITANDNGTATFKWSYEPRYVDMAAWELRVGDAYYNDSMISAVENGFEYTPETTFTAGQEITVDFIFNFAGGRHMDPFTYVYGSESAAVVEIPNPVLTAKAVNINVNSADIEWSVTKASALDAAELVVKINDEVVTESPYILTGLTANTAYSYTVTAVATLDGKEYAAEPVVVSFQTVNPDAKDMVYEGTLSDILPNAMVATDTYEEVPVTYNYTITYTPEKKVVIDVTVKTEKTVTGLVPQMFLNHGYSGNFAQVEGDKYTYTLPGTYDADTDLVLGFFCAYAGGAKNTEFDYKVGASNKVGVAGIDAENGERVVYTINGLRVNGELTPGLYIINGKKVLVK